MNNTLIEWTEMSWNPVTGCNKISAGCKYCYADRIAKEQQKKGSITYRNGFEVTLRPERLNDPYKVIDPHMIFVNSMSDMFHKDIPVKYTKEVFRVMNENPRHVFQVLTKRSDRLKDYDEAGLLNWSSNIWMGVSVENKDALYRIDDLRATNAKVKFLSCEPLIGPLDNMNLAGIDWVIVGGESGPIRRPIKEEWVWSIKEQCEVAGVPFFFKQWGGLYAKSGGHLLRGKKYLNYPKVYYERKRKLEEYYKKKGLLGLTRS